MTIQVGDRLPEATFTAVTGDGVKKFTTDEIFAGRKVVLFAVPGAFTPTCHLKHLPGFIRHAGDIKAKGVDTIACVAVNDAFVLDAWAKTTGSEGKIQFLADGNADFTRKLGLELDGSGFGLGIRSKRYAMVVDNGVVKALHVEKQPGEATESGAEAILSVL
ncbi:peroxiredoxin [Rhodoligotrophos defluvii]|uniref:peroxiredoxin n=1 Tax=Rhodoligotrophos defluvii TaxID=2561934 RepID=UPI0010C9D67D|nr:peroxiredoxin [Rhodoligotrophos defluvii]